MWAKSEIASPNSSKILSSSTSSSPSESKPLGNAGAAALTSALETAQRRYPCSASASSSSSSCCSSSSPSSSSSLWPNIGNKPGPNFRFLEQRKRTNDAVRSSSEDSSLLSGCGRRRRQGSRRLRGGLPSIMLLFLCGSLGVYLNGHGFEEGPPSTAYFSWFTSTGSPPSPSPSPSSVFPESLLDHALKEVEPMRKQIFQEGKLVDGFGKKVNFVQRRLSSSSSASATPLVERYVQGLFEPLYLQQLVLLRAFVLRKFAGSSSHFIQAADAREAAELFSSADAEFVQQAKDLVPVDSNWSFDEDRHLLRLQLEARYRGARDLEEEKADVAAMKQRTSNIVNKMHHQIDVLQARLQQNRAGNPLLLSASYRVPRTPVQIIGRYQEGHANVDFSLAPDRDPTNAQGGMVQGLGPLNLGGGMSVSL